MVAETLRGITIDVLTAEDLPAVLEIETASFTTPWSEASFFNEIKNPRSLATVARREGAVIGYIFASRIVDEGHVLTFAVHPAFRRIGVGSVLARDMLGRLRDEGCRFIFLEVRSSNAQAKRMYERLGFSVLGTRKNYYTSPTEDALVMVLKTENT